VRAAQVEPDDSCLGHGGSLLVVWVSLADLSAGARPV
jgi:hypothetical protein